MKKQSKLENLKIRGAAGGVKSGKDRAGRDWSIFFFFYGVLAKISTLDGEKKRKNLYLSQ